MKSSPPMCITRTRDTEFSISIAAYIHCGGDTLLIDCGIHDERKHIIKINIEKKGYKWKVKQSPKLVH